MATPTGLRGNAAVSDHPRSRGLSPAGRLDFSRPSRVRVGASGTASSGIQSLQLRGAPTPGDQDAEQAPDAAESGRGRRSIGTRKTSAAAAAAAAVSVLAAAAASPAGVSELRRRLRATIRCLPRVRRRLGPVHGYVHAGTLAAARRQRAVANQVTSSPTSPAANGGRECPLVCRQLLAGVGSRLSTGPLLIKPIRGHPDRQGAKRRRGMDAA
jgi:hypothetical protein